MTDVSKVQTSSASEVYDKFKSSYGDLYAAKVLTSFCNSMSTTVEQVVKDQNEYLSNVEVELNDIIGLEEDMNSKIVQLEQEIEQLLIKKENGTITEDEEAELVSKRGEITALTTNTNSQISSKNSTLKGFVEKSEGYATKLAVASDYAETAIDEGESLASTKDKRKSFWRKIFGGWDKSGTRNVGETLVSAGNNLDGKVTSANQLVDEIKTRTKSSV